MLTWNAKYTVQITNQLEREEIGWYIVGEISFKRTNKLFKAAKGKIFVGENI